MPLSLDRILMVFTVSNIVMRCDAMNFHLQAIFKMVHGVLAVQRERMHDDAAMRSNFCHFSLHSERMRVSHCILVNCEREGHWLVGLASNVGRTEG